HAADATDEGDSERLQQVVWNVIRNAVTLAPHKGRIVVKTVTPAPEKILIRTTDNGIGIEAEKIVKLFNAFELGQASITRRFGGLGLGLAISRALIDAHGGQVPV